MSRACLVAPPDASGSYKLLPLFLALYDDCDFPYYLLSCQLKILTTPPMSEIFSSTDFGDGVILVKVRMPSLLWPPVGPSQLSALYSFLCSSISTATFVIS